MNAISFPRVLRLIVLLCGIAWFGTAHATDDDEIILMSYPANVFGISMSDVIQQIPPGCFSTQGNAALRDSGIGAGESTDWSCIQGAFNNVVLDDGTRWSASGLSGWSAVGVSGFTATYTAHTHSEGGPDVTHQSTASVTTFCAYGGSQSTPGGLSIPGYCLLTAKPNHDNGCPNGACTRGSNPINSAGGNKYESATDYSGAGPFPLTITRAYNSSDANAALAPEGLGFGWRAGFAERLLISNASAPLQLCQEPNSPFKYYYCPVSNYLDYINNIEVTMVGPDGSDSRFTYTGSTAPDGTPLVNEQVGAGALYFVSMLPSPASGNGFRFVNNSGYTNYYDSNGHLVIKQNPAGLRQTYSYNTSGQLTTITDPAGRTLTFTYDGNGRIHTITNPLGGTYTYAYAPTGAGAGNLVTVTYPDTYFVKYVYSNSAYPHALTGLIDENKTAVSSTTQYATWGYDANGRANSSQHAGGVESFSFTYTTDTSGNQVTAAHVVEPNGLTSDIHFTVINFRTLFNDTTQRCSMCGDSIQSETYDTNGFVASKTSFNTTDINGNPITPVTTYVHDGAGLETSRTEAYGTADARTISTSWDPNLRQPTLVTEPGRTTTYTYDTLGNVLTKTVTDTVTSVARTTTDTYNTQGLLATSTDPRGKVTSYTYDTQDDLITITNPLGQQTHMTYDDGPCSTINDGMPHTIADANGVVTALCYDQRQRVITRIVAYGTADAAETDYTYDFAGQLTRVTLPTGSYINYTYDDAHRLTDVTDALGNNIHYTLDSEGNRHVEDTSDPSHALQKTLTRNYNSLEQLIGVVTTSLAGSGVNRTTAYAPDTVGNVTSITDPMGNVTHQGFDALNRLVEMVDPQTPVSGNTTYNYDPLDRIQDVTDPVSLNTHYDYDAFGDVAQLTSADTGVTGYTYDLDGNRLTKTDARGVEATYTYDDLNRMTGISYPDASRNVSYAYDTGVYGIGRLSGMTDASGITSYQYDARGNITQKTVTIHTHVFVVGYQYDIGSNLTGMTYPSGLHVDYGRDAVDRVNDVKINSSEAASGITYKPFGPITGLTLGNGLVESRSYDQAYRLTGISTGSIQGLSFGYNDDDDITSIGDSVNSGNNQTLGYDVLNRLTSASGVYGSQSYQYDLDGNRTQEILGGTTTLLGYSYQNPLNPGGNQLVGVGALSYSYDAMGNTLGDGNHSYNYDVAGRLAGYDSTTTAYLYNGLGQRSVKFPTDDAAPTVSITSPTGGVTGTVMVAASVADTFGVSGVQFKLDGVNLGAEVTSAPYTVSWNTSTATIGNHTLTAVARDPGGNTATSAPVTVSVLDVTAPSVSLTAPANGATNLSGTVTVSASASDNVGVTSVQFLLDGIDLGSPITAAPYTYAWDTSTATAGSHTLTAVASDAAGNSTTSTAVTVILADVTPPSVSVTAPMSGASLSGIVTISASASDNVGVASVQFQLDGANLGTPVTAAPYTYSWDTGTTTPGNHTLTAIASDATGNITTSSGVTITVLDVSAPSVSVTAPANGAHVAGTVTVSASASDNVGVTSLQFQLDGVNLGAAITAAPYTLSWDTTTATAGSHTLTAIASDAAGNHGTSASVTVTVDNSAPTVSVTAPAGGALLKGTVSVTASASDNIGVASVQFQLDGVNLGAPVTTAPYSVSWNTTTATVGAHSLTAIATDASGNATTSAAVSVSVDNVAPTVSLTSPAAGSVSGTVTLTASASDNVGVASVQFKLDGTNIGMPDTTAPYTLAWDSTPYINTGSHSLTAVATDTAGNTTTSTAVAVTVVDVNPVAITGSLTTTVFVTGSGTLQANAPAYTGQTLTFAIVTQPTNGTLTLTNASTGAFTYNPGAFEGTDSFTFSVSDQNGGSSTATENLTVHGPVPVITPSQGVNFEARLIGTVSAQHNFTLTNNGDTQMIVGTGGATLGGTNPGQFTIVTSGTTCTQGFHVAANGGTCIVVVTFTPNTPNNQAGSKVANVQVPWNDANGVTHNATDTLSGTSLTAIAGTPSPTSLTFGSTVVGAHSVPKTVTMTNSGTGTMTVVSLGFTGGGPFSVTTDGCGSSIAPGTCTYALRYNASAVGSQTGSFNVTFDVTSNGAVVEQTKSVSLSGTGETNQ